MTELINGRNVQEEQGTEDIVFEDALRELEGITAKLESGNVKLDEAVSLYERACYLQNLCKKRLQDAQMKVEHILKKEEQRRGEEE